MSTELTFKQYQEGLAQNIFLGLCCDSCGTHTVPPQKVCRNCARTTLQVVELEKSGVIRTFTVIRVAAEGMHPPFVVAMVETASGAWVMGNLIDIDPDTASMALIGRRVTIASQIVKGDVYAFGDIRSLSFSLVIN